MGILKQQPDTVKEQALSPVKKETLFSKENSTKAEKQAAQAHKNAHTSHLYPINEGKNKMGLFSRTSRTSAKYGLVKDGLELMEQEALPDFEDESEENLTFSARR